jgi:transposase, IS5 family
LGLLKVQGNMPKATKKRASKAAYTSPAQLELPGFESPFGKHLNPLNRWVQLSRQVPWDKIYSVYQRQLNNQLTGANGINPRVAIGSIIIKHICNLSDRETVQQIQENVYMQYFIGYSSFTHEQVFDPSLFVDLRKRLGAEQINEVTETIMGIANGLHIAAQEDIHSDRSEIPPPPADKSPGGEEAAPASEAAEINEKINTPEQTQETLPAVAKLPNAGSMMVDATACPQDIAYPTDLNLINNARAKSEQLIDILYEVLKEAGKDMDKPRTYREIARKEYLKVAQKKHKTKKEIRHAIRKQLCYLKRNIRYLHQLLKSSGQIPFDKQQYKYLLVIQTLYDQQKWMYDQKVHSIEHRIVSIHQPHVRPIVRGKTNAYVEFGAKIQASIMNGITFLEDLSWDAFNEGTRLMSAVEAYRRRFGYYPEKIFADKIYCNRENRAKLKGLNIKLVAKPLGRPSATAVDNHLRPGERNAIEGKFGQAKTAYGMNRIKARLSRTSESWIASIVLVLNLISLIGKAPFCHMLTNYFRFLPIAGCIPGRCSRGWVKFWFSLT